VDRQRTVDQVETRDDVRVEISEYVSRVCQDERVVAGNLLKRPPGEIDSAAAVRLRILAPVVAVELHVQRGRQGERWGVVRIALDGLSEQAERGEETLFLPGDRSR